MVKHLLLLLVMPVSKGSMNFSKIRYFYRKLCLTVFNSIAFYPVLIASLMMVLASGSLYLDTFPVGKEIVQWIVFVRVDQAETARSLLSALAGGLITLMVFSFSMVMVVLNQTASNYSPRVLPGLVSRRDHQIVLGIYLGTIGYTLATLSNVGSEIFEDGTPRLSVIVNLLLTFISLVAFVYFIHEISNVIQIGNILKKLYNKTQASLQRELSGKKYTEEEVALENSYVVNAWTSGYFFSVSEKEFLKGAGKLQLQVRLLKVQGTFLVKGESFLTINSPRTKEVDSFLQESFIFRHQELIEDNFYYGFKQITEVAVKALSPGINDPGTAVQALDFLRDLMSILYGLKGNKVIFDKGGKAVLVYKSASFKEIFFLCISSIRNYAESDIVVQVKLIQLIKRMQEMDNEDKYRDFFEEELQAIEEMAEKSLKSARDKQYIRNWRNCALEG